MRWTRSRTSGSRRTVMPVRERFVVSFMVCHLHQFDATVKDDLASVRRQFERLHGWEAEARRGVTQAKSGRLVDDRCCTIQEPCNRVFPLLLTGKYPIFRTLPNNAFISLSLG